MNSAAPPKKAAATSGLNAHAGRGVRLEGPEEGHLGHGGPYATGPHSGPCRGRGVGWVWAAFGASYCAAVSRSVT